MWRFCDLHTHTTPNEQCSDPWDAETFVGACVAAGLDVVAVTDHDDAQRVDDAIEAARTTDLEVIPGVEVSTDRGHVVLIAPGQSDSVLIKSLIARLGVKPKTQVSIDELTRISRIEADFAGNIVVVAAHADAKGSLLENSQALSLDRQIELAQQCHAIEVRDEALRLEWERCGVKQGPHLTLICGSDRHAPSDTRKIGTWMYLPEISAASLMHALAVRESSVCNTSIAPEPPRVHIRSVKFDGGLHDGVTIEFCERANAIIGPPNSGKSLIVDAIKYVFGVSSEFDEIERITSDRMDACFPDGGSIEIEVQTPAGIERLVRGVGSARPAQVPFRPIVFSQSELTRRAMARHPAIELLDIHVDGFELLAADIASQRDAVRTQFVALLEWSESARELRGLVDNPADGLAATQVELEKLLGAAPAARRSALLAQVMDWRAKARDEITQWADDFEFEMPKLPTSISVEGIADFQGLIPEGAIVSAVESARTSAESAIKAAVADVMGELDRTEAAAAAEAQRADAALAGAGLAAGVDVQKRISEIQGQLSELREHEVQLRGLDEKVEAGLERLRELVDGVQTKSRQLTQARRRACAEVNKAMRTFFSRIESGADTHDLDRILTDLAAGTWMRADSRDGLRASLDRFGILQRAVLSAEGKMADRPDQDDPARIVENAMRKGRTSELATLATTWPGDNLVIATSKKPNVQFESLTEGMRALAIKELSFVSSNRPIISDQPEDAVPTRSVFTSIVPTLRQDRAQRQFVVVSHDANIVVASDVDRVVVLGAEPDGSPHSGGLDDSRVRQAALEHLEGGPDAFDVRAIMYATPKRAAL